MQDKIFIAVAGNIGSGKTTLTSMLSKRFGWEAHFESVSDNPFLEDFYSDMKRWAFPLQIYFLNHRFAAHNAVIKGSKSAIQDRSIYEDAHIFARNLYQEGKLEKREFESYLSIYHSLCDFLPPPDLVVYLRRSLPKLKERIAKRGRVYEQNIPDSYLSHLNEYYDDWLFNYNSGKKLIIDTDGMDFLTVESDFEHISKTILEHLDQPDLFLGKMPGVTKAPSKNGPNLHLIK